MPNLLGEGLEAEERVGQINREVVRACIQASVDAYGSYQDMMHEIQNQVNATLAEQYLQEQRLR